jgi:predicted dehydrogenase
MIGCGVVAEEHLSILGRLEGVRVVGICDTNPEAARKTAAKFGISSTYGAADRMLKELKPDSVHIVTPPQSHYRLAETAIKAGCHVLVEKPMAVTADEARRMTALAEAHGRKLCVDHNHLYDPVVIKARRMIEAGDLGDILWVESYYGFDLGNNPDSRYLLPGGDKHWTFDLPGGLYQNLASHPLSLALDVLGKPSKISAHARYGRVLPHAPTDELRIVLETPRASGMVVVSLAASPRSQFLTVYGTKMTLSVDILNKWIIAQGTIKGLPKPISRALMHVKHGTTILGGTLSSFFKVLRGSWTYTDGMAILIRDFCASIHDNSRPAPVTADEGLATMEIMDEAWRQIGMSRGQTADVADIYAR